MRALRKVDLGSFERSRVLGRVQAGAGCAGACAKRRQPGHDLRALAGEWGPRLEG